MYYHDQNKKYEGKSGNVLRVNELDKTIQFMDGERISLDSILQITLKESIYKE
ncbi:MAG: hypothetical protein Q4C49_06820 [Bacillota bacterium]|nr:hypothetical protein [Bacillota bacterium]